MLSNIWVWDPRSGIRDPGSGKNLFRIPVPRSGSATLKVRHHRNYLVFLYSSDNYKFQISRCGQSCGSGSRFSVWCRLVRIRIRLLTLMRIRILLLIKVMRICDHASTALQKATGSNLSAPEFWLWWWHEFIQMRIRIGLSKCCPSMRIRIHSTGCGNINKNDLLHFPPSSCHVVFSKL